MLQVHITFFVRCFFVWCTTQHILFKNLVNLLSHDTINITRLIAGNEVNSLSTHRVAQDSTEMLQARTRTVKGDIQTTHKTHNGIVMCVLPILCACILKTPCKELAGRILVCPPQFAFRVIDNSHNLCFVVHYPLFAVVVANLVNTCKVSTFNQQPVPTDFILTSRSIRKLNQAFVNVVALEREHRNRIDSATKIHVAREVDSRELCELLSSSDV